MVFFCGAVYFICFRASRLEIEEMVSVKRGERSLAIRNYLAKHPSAGPTVVVGALANEGVVVTKNLVSSIKYGKMSKKGTGRAGRTRNGQISGSEAIRRVLATNPDATPKVICEQLSKQGIEVKTGLVSFVKFKFRQSIGAPKVTSAARSTSGNRISFEDLLEVKRVADVLGGADQLRRALDMLSQLA